MNASPFSSSYTPGMSLGPPDRQASPQSPINLGSNNPFRNRALSPTTIPTGSGGRPERPTSTNPFLDDTDATSPRSAPTVPISPIEKKDMTSNTRDLFENLTLDGPAPTKTNGTGYRPAPPRPDNASKAPSSSRSKPPRETSRRRQKEDPLDIFADPAPLSKTRTVGSSGTKERERRPQRRNSESSVMERTPKLLDPDDEKRRRERRRREREGRHKDGKSRHKKAHYQLDIIDKLDVTSIYGTGMFHHDGPFDACNPNRNRKGLRAAPMQAFPNDSTNMALGGAGPVNKNIDLNLYNGTMQEGYNDFAATGNAKQTEPGVNFDPTARIEPVHGEQSMGLGTSTFLEGAPASRSAIQRRVSENDESNLNGGGLQRKKSLAQRLRGMNRAPTTRAASSPYSPDQPTTPVQAGSSHSSSSRPNEKNPFFQDYDDAWDKKGVRIAEERGVGRARSASSPKQNTGLERKATNERSNSTVDDGQGNNAAGGGFLNRMKSLRKPKPQRRTSED